jgi:hypothetical protein
MFEHGDLRSACPTSVGAKTGLAFQPLHEAIKNGLRAEDLAFLETRRCFCA